jgi:hypothetical protein
MSSIIKSVNKIIIKYWGLFFIIVLSYFAIRPLLAAGYFPMHDDTQPARVFEMAKALKDGMLPVRWSLDLGYGYGYPLFNYYAPLAYYIGAIFYIVGFNALIATKIMIGLSILLSGIFMYLLSREFWGEAGGLVSGLFYLYAPYHALDIFVRGDVAELWAYAILPLVFLALYKLTDSSMYRTKTRIKDYWKWVVLGSLAYTAVIISHNLTAMMVTPFLLITIIISGVILWKNKKLYAIRYTLYAIIIGLLLSAFYWLPALAEMRYTNVLSQIEGTADYRLHFICPIQLWDSPWGFGGSTLGCVDGLSFRIGKLHILLSLLALLSLPLLWRKDRKKYYIVILLILLLTIGIFLTLGQSNTIWQLVPFLNYLQYPWRFLIMISFLTSLLAGVIVSILYKVTGNLKHHKYINIFVVMLLIASVLILYAKLFNAQTIYFRSDNDYISDYALKWKISKISDEYLPIGFNKPQNDNDIVENKIALVSGQALINIIENKTQNLWADVFASEPAAILISTAPFPGWNIYLNNVRQSSEITGKGYTVVIPKGDNKLELRFEPTTIELISDYISIVGMLMLVIVIIKGIKKGRIINEKE